jgi:nucleoside-triphosphatase THEP1
MEAPRAVILTGERGAGKTMLCLALAALSPRYTGLVSPPLLDRGGNRVGFAVRCLARGEEWVLGRSDTELDGPRFGRFSFSSAGIALAVDCLRGILTALPDFNLSPSPDQPPDPAPNRSRAPRPVVIIDEIGPLELTQGAGLAPVLPLLAGAGHLLLVVRPSLASRVEALVPRHERRVITVASENRTSLAPTINDWLA